MKKLGKEVERKQSNQKNKEQDVERPWVLSSVPTRRLISQCLHVCKGLSACLPGDLSSVSAEQG